MNGYHLKKMKQVLALAIGIALSASACSDPVAPATPTPATPTIPETFTGTLLPLGTDTHPFTVTQIGGIEVSLTGTGQSAPSSTGGTPAGSYTIGVSGAVGTLSHFVGVILNVQ